MIEARRLGEQGGMGSRQCIGRRPDIYKVKPRAVQPGIVVGL